MYANVRMIMDGANEGMEFTGEVDVNEEVSGDGEEMAIDAKERGGVDGEGVVGSSQRGVIDIVIGATVSVTLGAALDRLMGGQEVYVCCPNPCNFGDLDEAISRLEMMGSSLFHLGHLSISFFHWIVSK